MHRTKDQLYELIKDLKTKNEFSKEIEKRQMEYDFLFDEDTTALLIVDELGRNNHNIVKINELEPRTECTVFGKIIGISDERSFSRKNGSKGRVVNLEIKDNTSKCNLALWDHDVELVKKKQIILGTNVKVINGYVKDGYSGIELNVGRWGFIDIEPDDKPDIDENKHENSIKGTIKEIDPTRPFFKDTGEYDFVTNIKIQTKNSTKKITVWGKKVKEIQKLKKGDSVEIQNLSFKQYNGEEEIHMNNNTHIKKV